MSVARESIRHVIFVLFEPRTYRSIADRGAGLRAFNITWHNVTIRDGWVASSQVDRSGRRVIRLSRRRLGPPRPIRKAKSWWTLAKRLTGMRYAKRHWIVSKLLGIWFALPSGPKAVITTRLGL